MIPKKDPQNEIYELVLFLNTNDNVFKKIRNHITYEGKNQFFHEILNKNLIASQKIDSYSSFIKKIGSEIESLLISLIKTPLAPEDIKNIHNENDSHPFIRLKYYLFFLNNLFLYDENSIDYLDPLSLIKLNIDFLITLCNNSSANPESFLDNAKEFFTIVFENFTIVIKKNKSQLLEILLQNKLLEKLIILLEFSSMDIDEHLLKLMFSLAKMKNANFQEFFTNSQILHKISKKINEKTLEIIMISIELFFMFPIDKRFVDDLDVILEALKKRIIIEINETQINLKEFLKQIYEYCFKKIILLVDETQNFEKPISQNKKRGEISPEKTPVENSSKLENSAFTEVFLIRI